ncbi:MAG: SAM-dependent methyltransferase [Flavobacteriales bacterium]|jgi:SAM-dependent methyltransferase
MQERHSNQQQYFNEQITTTKKFVVPFISTIRNVESGQRILEIGCGESGNLMPFLDLGCVCVGVDLSSGKIKKGKEFFKGHAFEQNLTLIVQDIYKVKELEGGPFDVIMMRDVIEHIPNQEYFMDYVKGFLKDDGLIFFGFPPWQNPFGGHQQNCKSFLSKVPWFHLLPKFAYTALLTSFEEPKKVSNMLEIRDTGISLDRFNKILKVQSYEIKKKNLYLINPNYETKFGLKPRIQWKWLSSIPYFRNFVVTAGYYLVAKKQQ